MSRIQLLRNSPTTYLVEVPEHGSSTAVLFLPGISGGAFTDRFLPLVQACHVAGLAVVRVELWKDSNDASTKSFAGVHEDLLRIIEELKKADYTTFYGIGKSLGGAVMLTLLSPDINKKVLWAPAIGTTESNGTYPECAEKPFSSMMSFADATLDAQLLSTDTAPALFIHGTLDTVIPIDNSRTMASMMPNASLAVIDGADHSYRNPAHEAKVIDATVQFLM